MQRRDTAVNLGSLGGRPQRLKTDAFRVSTHLINFSRPFGIDKSASSALNLKKTLVGVNHLANLRKGADIFLIFEQRRWLLLGRPSPKRAAAAAGPREGEY